MGEQLFWERFVWFDNETRRGRYPNSLKLADRFEISTKTGQRSIDYFRDGLQPRLEYVLSRKGYRYTDINYQLPVTCFSEAEVLALLISRKLITDASAGSLAEELEYNSSRLGSIPASNLPSRTKPQKTFYFRWKGVSLPDPLVFQLGTSALLQGKLFTFCYYSPISSAYNMPTVKPIMMEVLKLSPQVEVLEPLWLRDQ